MRRSLHLCSKHSYMKLHIVIRTSLDMRVTKTGMITDCEFLGCDTGQSYELRKHAASTFRAEHYNLKN